MSSSQTQREPRIAHILFVDIVGFSKGSTTAQSRQIFGLTNLVNESETYRAAIQSGNALALPTGDGMILVFFDDVLAPARCARDVALAAQDLKLRMGITVAWSNHRPTSPVRRTWWARASTQRNA